MVDTLKNVSKKNAPAVGRSKKKTNDAVIESLLTSPNSPLVLELNLQDLEKMLETLLRFFFKLHHNYIKLT